MALLLHYTGQDYISRGLLKTELTPGSTSAFVGGCKTGRGFVFDGTSNSALDVNNIGIPMPTEFTVSCWFLVYNITSYKTIFTNGGLTNSGFQIDVFDNRVRTFGYNTANVYTMVTSSPGTIVANTWYHLTTGIEGDRIFLYLNGSFVAEKTMTGTIRTDYAPRIGYRLSGFPFKGQICNFKYYNHVLSQKEIREDYKSLILHYPLKNENEISPYIALNKVETFPSQSRGFTQTQISKYHLHIIGSWGGTTTVVYPSLRKAWNQYVDGNTYTITFTYRLNSYSNLQYITLRHSRWISDSQSGGMYYRMEQFPLGEWFTVTLTIKLDSTDPLSIKPLNPYVEIYTTPWSNNKPSNIDLEIKDVYVTEGESILPYPTTNTGAILDVSGFQRHITNLTNNTVTLDSKAQVYSASLKNDGTQALVGTSDLTDLNGIPELSISFRVYKTISTLNAILNNRPITGKGISIFILNTQIYVDISSRKIHSYTLPLNEWVNICITQSATEQKLYANGVLVSTMTPSSLSDIGNYTSISNSNMAGGAIDYKLNGNVQDIRFYATALTEDDVKDLYNTRQEIDNLANGYCYELVEGQSEVEMKANGQLYCDEVIENDDGTFSIEQNKTIKTKEIKEI